jgi:hypothetical protein
MLGSNEALCAVCRQPFDRKSLQPVYGSGTFASTITYACPPCADERHQKERLADGVISLVVLVGVFVVANFVLGISGPFLFVWWCCQ